MGASIVRPLLSFVRLVAIVVSSGLLVAGCAFVPRTDAPIRDSWRYVPIEKVNAEGSAFFPDSIVRLGDMLIAVGDTESSDVVTLRSWYSKNGTDWRAGNLHVTRKSPISTIDTTLAHRGNGLLLLGTAGRDDGFDHALALQSNDGINWTDYSPVPTKHWFMSPQVASADEGVLAMNNDIWLSRPESIHWEEVPNPFAKCAPQGLFGGAFGTSVVATCKNEATRKERVSVASIQGTRPPRVVNIPDLVMVSGMATIDSQVLLVGYKSAEDSEIIDMPEEPEEEGPYGESVEVVCYLTEDEGKTWAESRPLPAPEGSLAQPSSALTVGTNYLALGSIEDLARNSDYPVVWVKPFLSDDWELHRLPPLESDRWVFGEVAQIDRKIIILAYQGDSLSKVAGFYINS